MLVGISAIHYTYMLFNKLAIRESLPVVAHKMIRHTGGTLFGSVRSLQRL